jgi:hypothetical protein
MSRIRIALAGAAVLELAVAGIGGPDRAATGPDVNQVSKSCAGLSVHLAGYDAGIIVLKTDGISRENGAFGAGYDFYYPWYQEFGPHHTWRLQTFEQGVQTPVYDSGTVDFNSCQQVDQIAPPTFTEGTCGNPPKVNYPDVTGVTWVTTGEIDFGRGVRIIATPAAGYTIKPGIDTIWDHTFRSQGVCLVPGAPTGVTAVAGNADATVTWTAPVEEGSAPVTGYTVTSAPGAFTCTGAVPAAGCVVTGLTNGTAYHFTVTATNAVGDSAASQPSAVVVPEGPAVLPVTVPGKVRSLRVSGTARSHHRVVRWRKPAQNGGVAVTRYSVVVKKGHHRLLRRVVRAPHHKFKLPKRARRHGGAKVIVKAANSVGYGRPVQTTFHVR